MSKEIRNSLTTRGKLASFSRTSALVINDSSTAILSTGTSALITGEGITSPASITFSALTAASITKDILLYRRKRERERIAALENKETKRTSIDITAKPYPTYDVRSAGEGKGFEYIKSTDKKRILVLMQNTTIQMAKYHDNSGFRRDESDEKVIHIYPIPDKKYQPPTGPQVIYRHNVIGKHEYVELQYLEDITDESDKKWEIRQKIKWHVEKRHGITHISIDASDNKTCWQDLNASTHKQAISVEEIMELQQNILSKLPQQE